MHGNVCPAGTRALGNRGPNGLTQSLPVDSGVELNESVEPRVDFFDEALSPTLEAIMTRIRTGSPGDFGDS